MLRLSWLIALYWLAFANQTPAALASEPKEKQPQAPGMELFTNGAVLQLHLEIPPAAIESGKAVYTAQLASPKKSGQERHSWLCCSRSL